MILRRLSDNLKTQNWTTIAIELAIVILGVFIGSWVNDWSRGRAADRETRELLVELRPEMAHQHQVMAAIRAYFATTAHYADTAYAGWRRDPRVSDSQFVTAAYQASQVYGVSSNGQTWATIFGGDQLRRIRDPAIRSPLQRLMTYDYSQLSYDRVATPYRANVRLLVPNAIQQQIRHACGDRLTHDGQYLMLPPTCPVVIQATAAASTAAVLRAHPELVGQLAQHQAAIATQLINVDLLESQIQALDHALARLG